MRPGLSLGFMGLFGRSPALRAFDTSLRRVDLHPKLVPDAVKLTAVRMLMDETGGREPDEGLTDATTELLAYCMVGAETFEGANGPAMTQAVEHRIETALESGTSLDAKLILLALQAKVIQPSVVDRYGLEVASD